MDVNEAIVKTLELIGVDHIFGGTGQVNGSMLLALKKSKQIKTIIIRDEQGASFMACGYSMFSDKLGVCFATGGPGEFNLFSGLAVAYSDSLPVLAISGYTSKPDRGKGALNEDTGLNRTPDGPKMFNATTKKSWIIEDPDSTCDILEEAINLAYEGRPGPVHIHVPKNITIAKVNNFREIKLKVKPVLPQQEKIDQAVEILAKSIRDGLQIMALIGYGTIRSHAQKEVLDFLERFQIPFATTMDAKGIISENHPLALGVYGTSGDPGANRYFEDAGVIVAIGNSFAQNATFGFKSDLYKGKTLIHINIDPHEIDKVYKADCGIVSDAKPAILEISERLSKKIGNILPKKIRKQFWYDLPIEYSGKKIHPALLVKEMSRNLPKDAIVLGDAGSHMLWLNCYLHLTQNQSYQNPGSFGPMASHVDAAIGVKCALPDKYVICGCGDGAYQMAGFELMTAVQYNIPVTWVIFNNGEFNVIKKFLLNLFGEEAFMQFQNPDFVMYAQACGAQGFRVTRLEDFEPAFKKALDSNRPTLIDVVVESEVYPPFALGKV
ncbi:MAG: thiamine pyrophosphate-binding protein [Candidatus Omnitrophica bacterium]|nr:thiamine pyrophosphate-binding protein [Candidatus Omnitrophota bacterium]